MAESSILLPGEQIEPGSLPQTQTSKTSRNITLGPGLRFSPPSTIWTTTSGTLSADTRKTSLWLESNGNGRYTPMVGDLVIAIVHHSSTDSFHCALSPHTALATLGHLSFEGANRKTRPQLQRGSLVYARVAHSNKYLDPEIECVHPSTGKSDGMGELKGGMLFDISLGMARRMLMSKKGNSGIILLDDLAEENKLRFEIAVGRNGAVWIHSDSIKTTIAIGRALQTTDQNCLTSREQQKLVRKIMREA